MICLLLKFRPAASSEASAAEQGWVVQSCNHSSQLQFIACKELHTPVGLGLWSAAMTKLQAFIIPVTPFQQNCSLVYDEVRKIGAIVDPGGDVPRILGAIKQSGIAIEKILLTHGHIDHAGGAAALKDALQVPIEGPHIEDTFLLEALPESGQSTA
jgi:hypothetical protein